MIIRTAIAADIRAINDIYNLAVDTRCSTGSMQHSTLDARLRWFQEHTPDRYPVLVADFRDGEEYSEDADLSTGENSLRLTPLINSRGDHCSIPSSNNAQIAGWISLSTYRMGREGMRFTGEIGYYIHPDFQRRGIASALLAAMITRAKEIGYKTLIAIIFSTNEGSLRLLTKHGFSQWGMLPDVVEIDDRIFSHLYCGKKI